MYNLTVVIVHANILLPTCRFIGYRTHFSTKRPDFRTAVYLLELEQPGYIISPQKECHLKLTT